MKFDRIQMLFFIWVIPILFFIFFYGIRKQKRILLRFSSARGLKSIVPEDGHARRLLKFTLILLIIFLVIIALAGPKYGYKWEKIERKGVDIIIALDCSRSMLATDIRPTRLDRAKREVFDLIAMLQGDRTGLVAFAGTAFLQCPLTLDYDAFDIFLNALSPDFLPVGGTDIAGALETAFAAFNSKDNTEKAIILITDGENTGGDPVKSIKMSSNVKAKLFCIGVGKTQGVPVPDEKGGFKKDKSGNIVLTRLDERTLQEMALLTGGAYVRSVAGDMDLDEIYKKEIRGKMEARGISNKKKQVWEDRYQWFLFLAIFLFIIELFFPSIKKNTSVFILVFLLLSTGTVYAEKMQESMKKGLDAYKKENYQKALKYFIDAQLEYPDNARIYYNIGNAYYKTDNFDAAAKNYKRAINCKEEKLKQKAYYNMGNAQYRQGLFKEAIQSYNEALKIDSDDIEAKQNLEFVKEVMKKKEQEKKKAGKNRQGNKEEKGDNQKNSQKEKDSKKEGSGKNNSSKEKRGNKKDKKKRLEEKSEKKPDNLEASRDAEKKERSEYAGSKGEMKNKKQKSSGFEFKKASDNNGKRQLERMLNRLKDMPGRAMMPHYTGRQVEKDW
ncbi:MAG: hypothetical protein DRH24_02360 [Deltaproteobacteria bacterium]|nr:MAG: hypothetical protein DRH24_02360 [Deltaproteobacteria bacterium]